MVLNSGVCNSRDIAALKSEGQKKEMEKLSDKSSDYGSGTWTAPGNLRARLRVGETPQFHTPFSL